MGNGTKFVKGNFTEKVKIMRDGLGLMPRLNTLRCPSEGHWD